MKVSRVRLVRRRRDTLRWYLTGPVAVTVLFASVMSLLVVIAAANANAIRAHLAGPPVSTTVTSTVPPVSTTVTSTATSRTTVTRTTTRSPSSTSRTRVPTSTTRVYAPPANTLTHTYVAPSTTSKPYTPPVAPRTYSQTISCPAAATITVIGSGSGSVTTSIRGPRSASGGMSVSVSGPAGVYTVSATDSGGSPHLSWRSAGARCG